MCRECGWRSPQYKDLRQKLVQKESGIEDLGTLYRKDVREGKILSVSNMKDLLGFEKEGKIHKKRLATKEDLSRRLPDLLSPKRSSADNEDLLVLKSKEEQMAGTSTKVGNCECGKKNVKLPAKGMCWTCYTLQKKKPTEKEDLKVKQVKMPAVLRCENRGCKHYDRDLLGKCYLFYHGSLPYVDDCKEYMAEWVEPAEAKDLTSALARSAADAPEIDPFVIQTSACSCYSEIAPFAEDPVYCLNKDCEHIDPIRRFGCKLHRTAETVEGCPHFMITRQKKEDLSEEQTPLRCINVQCTYYGEADPTGCFFYTPDRVVCCSDAKIYESPCNDEDLQVKEESAKDLSKLIHDLEIKMKEVIFKATAAQAEDLYKEVQKLSKKMEDLSLPESKDLTKDLGKQEKDLCMCFFCGMKHLAPKGSTGHISYVDGSLDRKIFVCHYCASESLEDLFAATPQEVLGKLLYNRAMDNRTW